MKPDIALGAAVGPDAAPLLNRLMLIIFGSLTMGILSTLAWHYAEGGRINEQILVAVFSISWFIFVSFLFLLFGRTRLLHIVSFFVLLILCAYVQDSYTGDKLTGTTGSQILTATTILAALIGFLLLVSYASSRKEEELYELKTKIQSGKEQHELMRLMETHVNEKIKDERKELEEEMQGQDITVRKKIAEAFIEDIMVRSKQGRLYSGASGASGGAQKKKNQLRDEGTTEETLAGTEQTRI